MALKNTRRDSSHYLPLAILIAAVALAADARAVTIDWATVGSPGNAPDTQVMITDGTTGYGSVDYTYQIGKYDVTNSQYVDFLNAKDPTGGNLLGLYYSGMTTDTTIGGINYNAGAALGSKYSIISGHADQPVTYVTFYDTLRFANWLNNGQGNGSTETGAYTLGALGPGGVPINGDSITRNAGASVFLPSENEWYKAAYYDPKTQTYNHFATSTSTQPAWGAPPQGTNGANYTPGGWPNPDYADALNHLTNVGAYAGSPSPYGTFDQSGNVDQWNESIINSKIGTVRGLRGGAYNLVWDHTAAFYRSYAAAKFGWYADVGFRVAGMPAVVPEPSSFALAVFAFAGLATCLWRRRRT